MATQAVISLIDSKKKTIIKVVAGVDGGKAPQFLVDLFKLHKSDEKKTLKDVLDLALQYFGRDRTVVMDKDQTLCHGDTNPIPSEVEKAYRPTFNNPYWNPRWKHGTADYVILAMI